MSVKIFDFQLFRCCYQTRIYVHNTRVLYSLLTAADDAQVGRQQVTRPIVYTRTATNTTTRRTRVKSTHTHARLYSYHREPERGIHITYYSYKYNMTTTTTTCTRDVVHGLRESPGGPAHGRGLCNETRSGGRRPWR